LIFRLQSFPVKGPAPSLGGKTRRFKPIIPCLIIGPKGQALQYVQVDTAADDTVFSINVANQIGIDLSAAPGGHSQPVGNAPPVALLFAPAILLLDDSREVYRWRAVVGFTTTRLRFPLLGIAGGLEHFRTTLDVFNQSVELVPQPSLPATQDATP
jgi:hypothetical protein